MLALALLLLAITYYVSKRKTKREAPPQGTSTQSTQNMKGSLKSNASTKGAEGTEGEEEEGSYKFSKNYNVDYDLTKVDCCSGNACLPYTNGLSNGNGEEACPMIQFYRHI